MADKITCPNCHETAEPLVKVRDLAICASCGTSLHVDADSGVVRPMRHSDTETLELAEMAQLRRARGSVVRADRPHR